MRQMIALVLLLLAADPARALDFARIGVFDPAEHSQAVTDCDRLASHPSDPHRVIEGLRRDQMDMEAAMAACHRALETDPDNPRLNYQLARAYGYSGRHAEGDSYRMKALMAGYPQSLFVMGYIKVTGWDGEPPDPCTGGELIRRSAHAGRYAGLVAFPHYYLMGQFAGCGDYPPLDQGEMLGFLEQAGSSDFYRGILVDQLKLQMQAALPTRDNGSEAELSRLLGEFLVGASINDAATHQRFWAEDLVYTSSAGQRFGKAEIMAGLGDAMPADPPGPSYSARDVRIKDLGETAVITFRLVAEDAQGDTQSYYNTGVFRRNPAGWQAVTWQATKAVP